jgi:preprotein translocase subunit SecG
MKGTMPMDMLASWVHVVIPVVFVVTCILLMLVILLQKGRGGGLSGAFGGGGGYSAFGAKTGDVFTWITVALTALFILVACLGVWFYIPEEGNVAVKGKPVPAQGTPESGERGPAGTSTTNPS